MPRSHTPTSGLRRPPLHAPGPSTAASGAVAIVVGALLLAVAWIGRHLWFFSDDWNIYADYHSGNLLEPFNGHLSAGARRHLPGSVPHRRRRLLRARTGSAAWWPWEFSASRWRRWTAGRLAAMAAVLVVAAVLWNSFGTTNVMFPFLMNFSMPDRRSGGDLVAPGPHRGTEVRAGPRRGDCGTSCHFTWLALALATSGLGVMTARGGRGGARRGDARPCGGGRRSRPRSLLWMLWWVGHRGANEIITDPGAVVAYFVRMLWAGTTAVAAGSTGSAAWCWRPCSSRSWCTARAPAAPSAPRAVAAMAAARWLRRAHRTHARRPRATHPAGRTALRLDHRRVPGAGGGCDVAVPDPQHTSTASRAVPLRRVPPARSSVGPSVTVATCRPGGRAWSRWSRPGARPRGVAVGRRHGGLGRRCGCSGSGSAQRTVRHRGRRCGAGGTRHRVYRCPTSRSPLGGYLDAVADVGSPLQGATLAEIGGRPDQREAADAVFFGSVELSIESPPAGESLTADGRAGCGRSLDAMPGDSVLVLPADLARQAAAPTRGGRRC